MIELNFVYVALTAIIPIITGFIWYNKAIFGGAWMRAAGVSDETLKNGNMPLIMLLSLVLSVLIAMSLMSVTIHQLSMFSVFGNDPTLKDPQSANSLYIADFMEKYGNNFRTFRHGLLHGSLCGLFLVMPILAITAVFERKGFKYIAINSGYWIITLGLMGGFICAFA